MAEKTDCTSQVFLLTYFSREVYRQGHLSTSYETASEMGGTLRRCPTMVAAIDVAVVCWQPGNTSSGFLTAVQAATR